MLLRQRKAYELIGGLELRGVLFVSPEGGPGPRAEGSASADRVMAARQRSYRRTQRGSDRSRTDQAGSRCLLRIGAAYRLGRVIAAQLIVGNEQVERLARWRHHGHARPIRNLRARGKRGRGGDDR